MEENDPAGGNHRSGRPRDQCLVRDERRQIEQAQPIEQHRDVAAGENHDRGPRELARQLPALPGHGVAAARVPPLLELGMNRLHSLQVMPIEGAQVLERGSDLSGEGLLVRGILLTLKLEQLAVGGDRVVEANPVEPLKLLQPRLAVTMGARQLAILVEHLLGPSVDAEIDDVLGQASGQGVVLVLLPPCRDHGHRTVELADDCQHGGPPALRT